MTTHQNQQNLNIIPHSRPTLGQEDIKPVVDVIDSAQIAQGEVVHRFEQAFARKMAAGYAAATSSGTAALHLTLLAMGVGTDDEVIIPSYVCIALLNAIKYIGAMPIMAEIDLETYNLDPDDVRKRLTRRTKAVIVPHLFGLAANMEGLLALDVPIIEDCAQAVGSTYHHRYVGTFGQAAVFSFYATKVMTTGEGGMVISNSKDLIDRVKDLGEYDQKDDYKLRYNYKMTDIHAAMGLAQLDRLETFIGRRVEIAKQYDKAFDSLGVQLPPKEPGHIYFRYVIGFGNDSSPYINVLREQGIGCAKPVYLPLHRYLRLKGYPRTKKAWEQTISIPIYPSLSKEETDRVIEMFIETFRKITRDGKILF